MVNAVGLFLEESEEKDYLGLLSFVALSYIMVPFQAYASVKGFIEKEEGPWFRTPKTGRITDIFTRGKFYRWIAGILPGRRPTAAPAALARISNFQFPISNNQYVALATANSQFNNFNIKPKRMRWVSKVALAILLALTVTVYSVSRGVPEVYANQYTTHYLDPTALGSLLPIGETLDFNTPDGASCTSLKIDKNIASLYWYTQELPTDADDGSTITGDWNFVMYFSSSALIVDFNIEAALCDDTGCTTSKATIAGPSSYTCDAGLCNGSGSPVTLSIGNDAVGQTFEDGDPKRVAFILTVTSTGNPAKNYFYLDYNNNASCPTRITHPTLTVPEKLVFLAAAAPLIPLIVLWMKKKKGVTALLNL